MATPIKTLENYKGHKNINGLFQKIINQIPKHTGYAELFAGSAAIASLFTVPAEAVMLNDINAEVHSLLQKKFSGSTVIYNLNALEILRFPSLYGLEGNVFIFLDPPYLHETRPNSLNLYAYEMTDFDHLQLLETVAAMEQKIMLIHPKCKLYDDMLKSWRKVLVNVRYHNKTQVECLYMNYDEPTILQDYSYLGNDCWERQRIKRKVTQYVKKFSLLPVLERNYIIQELNKIKNKNVK